MAMMVNNHFRPICRPLPTDYNVGDTAVLVSCVFIHAILITYIQRDQRLQTKSDEAVEIYTDESIFLLVRNHSDAFGGRSALIG